VERVRPSIWKRPPPELAVGVAQGGIGFLLASLGPCLILLSRDLAVPLRALSWVSAGFGVGLLLFGTTGRSVLRLGAGRVLSASAAGLALGAVLLATARWMVTAQAGALSLGLGGAGVVLASWALLSGPGAARRLTYANAASSLAGIGAPPLIGALDAVTGRGRMALLLSLPPLVWLALSSWRADREGSVVPPPDEVVVRPRSLASLAARAACVVAAVSAEFAFVVWGAARLQACGLSPSAAAAGAVAFPVGMGTGRLFAPAIADRAPVVFLGAALGIGSCLVAAAPASPALVIGALAGAGLGIAPLFPLMLARVMEASASSRRGASLGTAASGMAVLGAPLLLGAIAGVSSLRVGFLFAAAALVPLLWVGLGARRLPKGGGRPASP